MIEVIPAILEKKFQEIQEKILKVEPYVKWVQLDVVDGNFAPAVTWNNPEDLKSLDTSVLLEVDLMILEPEKFIDEWIEAGVKRILVHIEAIGEERSHTKKDKPFHLVKDLADKCHNKGVEFGLSLNPETSIELIYDFIPYLDSVLFLGVSPGFGGQKFREEVLGKIKNLRINFPNVKIEVDGGINLETGKKCVEAGANILVAGSYIFGSGDIQKAIEELQDIIQNTKRKL